MDKYFLVPLDKEERDTESLIQSIVEDGWVDNSTVVVNCFPEYSGRLTHMVNHRLSYLNKNELFEVIELAMPYPNSTQVWNSKTMSYDGYDTYLKNWGRDNIFAAKYLFICNVPLSVRNTNKIRLMVRSHLDNERFRFASLYTEKDIPVLPDYYVETYELEKQGRTLFQWENMDNKNWR